MKKIVAAALLAAVAVGGAAVASTECAVEAVDGAKVTVTCEAGKAGDKVNMKAGEVSSACVVDSVEGGKTVLTCEGTAVKAGDKVSVEPAATEQATAPAAEQKEENAPHEGC